MAEWTSYLITAEKMNQSGTRIEMVEVRGTDGEVCGGTELWSQAGVISACQSGKRFRTAAQEDGGEWSVGDRVYLVESNGAKFLRTDECRVIADYLGSLPQI